MRISAHVADQRLIYTIGDCDHAPDLFLCVFKEITKPFETGEFIYFEDLFLCYENAVKILHSDEIYEMRKLNHNITKL